MTRFQLALRGLALLSLCVLSSCRTYFNMDVQAPNREGIGSVFVLFGDEKVLESEDGAQALSQLVQPGRLKDEARYPAYVECSFDEYGDWAIRSSRESEDIVRIENPTEGHILRFRFNHTFLEQIPRLTVAVVVRDSQNNFRWLKWTPEFIANLKEPLSIDVTGSDPAVMVRSSRPAAAPQSDESADDL